MSKGFSLGSFSMGAAIGIFLAALWFLGNPESILFKQPQSLGAHPTSEALPPPSGAIAVSDQSAGESVLVDSLTVPPPGVWVAVRDVVGSSLGNVLGAVKINGPRSNFTIPLLRATLPDHSYAVQLYRDDDSGTFDPSADSVYVDFDTGSRVVAYFKTAP